MPELPEVENTVLGLNKIIKGQYLKKMIVKNYDMRWRIPKNMPHILENKMVISCSRRGKFILLHFDDGVQIIHLGMSGVIYKSLPEELPKKHDHVEWIFNNVTIRLNDPRRFGCVLWHSYADGNIESHFLIKNLGIEPFSLELNGEYLYKKIHNKKTSIKQVLMDSKIIVGIGNIYASEILFKSKIYPFKLSNKITSEECDLLISSIRDIFNIAIKSGGSSIRNYVGIDGKEGMFIQKYAAVYNKENLQCKSCSNKIVRLTQQQRSTYFCKYCQNI